MRKPTIRVCSTPKIAQKRSQSPTPAAEGSVSPSGFGLGLEAANIANLSGAALLHQLAGSSPGGDHEMPVDPNEPTYCVCNSVR